MFGTKKNTLITDRDAVNNIFERHQLAGIFPNRETAVGILVTGTRRIYLGIDPTGPHVHLGHVIPLLFLKDLWRLGHVPVVVIGDFTARIGDPTDKTAARKPLSSDEVEQNMKEYLQQIELVLLKGSFEIKYNAQWLEKLSLADVLGLANMVTVQQMLQRDMFKERQKNDQPIGLNEFLYPLMQGYDSVAMNIDGEVGGNDQTFNMLIGRDLERKFLNKEKLVFATPLLVDASSGKKMSKSEGDLIAVNDEPQEIRRKVLAMDDAMIKTVFELCTEKSIEWIRENQNKDPRSWKEDLADELVRMFHGESAVGHSRAAVEIQGGQTLATALKESGAAVSMSEAKRLIEQGAVEVNDTVIKDWNHELRSGDKLRVGKGKFLEVK